MARKHNVFMDAVSEMKHFLLGAALVLALVTVVPALAQEGPGMPPPPGGNPPPPMNQGGGMPPPPQGDQQFGMPQQGGQQGNQPRGDQQFGMPPQGGQQGNQPRGDQQFGMPQGGQQGNQPRGDQQFGMPQQGGKQFGQSMNGKMGGPNNGEFKCFSDSSAKTPEDCDAADAKSGFKKSEMRKSGSENNGAEMKEPEFKNNSNEKKDFSQNKGQFDMGQFPTSTPTTKGQSKKMAPEFKLDLTEFEDESIVDGEAVFDSVLGQFEGKKLSSKAAKAAAKSVEKFLNEQSELLCAAIEDEDDASDCVDAFEKLTVKIGKAKDSKSLLKAITKLRDAYYDLAGFDIPDEE